MLMNCGDGEHSWESFGLQRDQTSQYQKKASLNIHWKDWCWTWSSNTSATWCEELTHLKRPWCWERLKAGGAGHDRGWVDITGWMTSPTSWTWVWGSSRSWWWTGKPGALQSMGSQTVRHDCLTKLSWIFLCLACRTTGFPLKFEFCINNDIFSINMLHFRKQMLFYYK